MSNSEQDYIFKEIYNIRKMLEGIKNIEPNIAEKYEKILEEVESDTIKLDKKNDRIILEVESKFMTLLQRLVNIEYEIKMYIKDEGMKYVHEKKIEDVILELEILQNYEGNLDEMSKRFQDVLKEYKDMLNDPDYNVNLKERKRVNELLGDISYTNIIHALLKDEQIDLRDQISEEFVLDVYKSCKRHIEDFKENEQFKLMHDRLKYITSPNEKDLEDESTRVYNSEVWELLKLGTKLEQGIIDEKDCKNYLAKMLNTNLSFREIVENKEEIPIEENKKSGIIQRIKEFFIGKSKEQTTVLLNSENDISIEDKFKTECEKRGIDTVKNYTEDDLPKKLSDEEINQYLEEGISKEEISRYMKTVQQVWDIYEEQDVDPELNVDYDTLEKEYIEKGYGNTLEQDIRESILNGFRENVYIKALKEIEEDVTLFCYGKTFEEMYIEPFERRIVELTQEKDFDYLLKEYIKDNYSWNGLGDMVRRNDFKDIESSFVLKMGESQEKMDMLRLREATESGTVFNTYIEKGCENHKKKPSKIFEEAFNRKQQRASAFKIEKAQKIAPIEYKAKIELKKIESRGGISNYKREDDFVNGLQESIQSPNVLNEKKRETKVAQEAQKTSINISGDIIE
ncbi:MAG: hypothetical protein RSE57_05525 [Clostridia bacterium]